MDTGEGSTVPKRCCCSWPPEGPTGAAKGGDLGLAHFWVLTSTLEDEEEEGGGFILPGTQQ